MRQGPQFRRPFGGPSRKTTPRTDRDPNRVFPLERLRKLEAAGVIGEMVSLRYVWDRDNRTWEEKDFGLRRAPAANTPPLRGSELAARMNERSVSALSW